MESLNVALAVKNTFVHYRQQEDSEQHCRSNSAPPTCRLAKQDKQDKKGDQSPSVETTSVDSDLSDNDDAISYCETYVTEYEDLSPSVSRDEVNGSDDAYFQQNSNADHQGSAQQQQQLEQMSQMVMDIWAKLREVESSIEVCEDCEPAKLNTPAHATSNINGPAPPRQKLDSNASAFVPVVPAVKKLSGVQGVFAAAEEAIMAAPGVADVDVNIGPAGTLVTISVRLQSCAWKLSVIEACKAALLDVAACSESTYVLGYEAKPFEDIHSSGFFATLATLPSSMRNPCWDTYMTGTCPWRRSCKCQHPGKKELQPVKVVIVD